MGCSTTPTIPHFLNENSFLSMRFMLSTHFKREIFGFEYHILVKQKQKILIFDIPPASTFSHPKLNRLKLNTSESCIFTFRI